jgi:hypothetical protein
LTCFLLLYSFVQVRFFHSFISYGDSFDPNTNIEKQMASIGIRSSKSTDFEYYEKVLGAEHPYTLTSTSNLVFLLHQQQKYALARPLYERALSGFEKMLEPTRSTTMKCCKRYSSLLQKLNKVVMDKRSVINESSPTKKCLMVVEITTYDRYSQLLGFVCMGTTVCRNKVSRW